MKSCDLHEENFETASTEMWISKQSFRNQIAALVLLLRQRVVYMQL